MENKTFLGYETLNPNGLTRLFGSRHEIPRVKSDREARIKEQLLSELETIENVDRNRLDVLDWSKFPRDFPIYNHGEISIEKFIRKVATELSETIVSKVEKFCQEGGFEGEIIAPEDFIIQPGWVRYPYEKGTPEIGVPPQGDVFVIDTETFVRGFPTKHCNPKATKYKEGTYGFSAPLIATASDNEANYVWMHKNLTEENLDLPWEVELVPLEERECVVLTFNSAYDIPRLENSYTKEESRIKHLDLMSMVTARHGFSKEQIATAKALRKKATYVPGWIREGFGSSLLESYNYYCGNDYGRLSSEDKKIREFFKEMTSLRELWDNLTQMLHYAQKDSTYTFRLAKRCIPDYLGAMGADVSIACHADFADMRFSVDGEKWGAFIEDCEDRFHKNMAAQIKIFDRIAEELYLDYLEGYINEENIEKDFWYSKLDWKSHGKLNYRKVKYYDGYDISGNILVRDIEIKGSAKVGDRLADCQKENPNIHKLKKNREEVITEKTEGYLVPEWYFPKYKEGSLNITVKKRISHYLLRLKYKGHNLYHEKENGWINTKGEKPIHKKGVGLNVGCAISNDQYKYYLEGDWESDGCDDYLEELFAIANANSFWNSTRTRALDKLVYNDVMIAEVIPVQTVTQRSGSKLWSVVPNPQENKIGSDFKNLIKPEKGNKLLGFDFSSQEAVIFALFGSSVTGYENSTKFSHTVLTGSGDTEPPSDIHAVVGRLNNIPRKIAKNLVYCIQFGGGLKTATDTILSGDRTKTVDEARELSQRILNSLKGKMISHDGKNYRYTNGLASDCFNVLMDRGDRFVQEFPLTEQEYPCTLQTRNTARDFLLTRNNLQIQGTGKHLLEVMMLLTKYWCKKFNVPYHLVLTIHDAMIVETSEEKVKEMAAILNQAHVFSWAYLRYKLGIKEIGLSGMFLQSIEVGDFVMKSVTSPTITPFNPKEIKSDRYALTINDLISTSRELFS